MHLETTTPNVEVQEVARACYHGWHQAIATGLPELREGITTTSSAPGHGIELGAAFLSRKDTSRRLTAL
ncbi:L-alanine-DL-glutamate epimerase-like enolase superfamily enzyme [Sinomonas sp. RB5]